MAMVMPNAPGAQKMSGRLRCVQVSDARACIRIYKYRCVCLHIGLVQCTMYISIGFVVQCTLGIGHWAYTMYIGHAYQACTLGMHTPNYRTAVSQGLHYWAPLCVFFKYNLGSVDNWTFWHSPLHIWLSPMKSHLMYTYSFPQKLSIVQSLDSKQSSMSCKNCKNCTVTRRVYTACETRADPIVTGWQLLICILRPCIHEQSY